MVFPPWFLDFCQPDADRFQILTNELKKTGVNFFLLKLGPYRHIHVPGCRQERPSEGERVLLAHYDRVSGSPGANDNGSSVLHLMEYLAGAKERPSSLRVVFTDGEEFDKKGYQGSYWLGRLWTGIQGLFPLVFDMTGIGDTFVMGQVKQHWIQQGLRSLQNFKQQRLWSKRLLSACGAGDYLEIDMPFSDNLGFLLAGLGAVQISLLPRKQALAYREERSLDANNRWLPEAWRTMHTKDDLPQTLEEKTQTLMKNLFERLEQLPLV